MKQDKVKDSDKIVEKGFHLLWTDTLEATLQAAQYHDIPKWFTRSAVLFSAVCVEAAANSCLMYVGINWTNKQREDFDKLPPIAKFDVFLLASKKPFLDRSTLPVQKITELIAIRNAFVHTKPQDAEHWLEGFHRKPFHSNILKIPTNPNYWTGDSASAALNATSEFFFYLFSHCAGLSHIDTFRLLNDEFYLNGKKSSGGWPNWWPSVLPPLLKRKAVNKKWIHHYHGEEGDYGPTGGEE